MTETTNAVGCAVFAYIPVGGYDVNVKQPGLGQPGGRQRRPRLRQRLERHDERHDDRLRHRGHGDDEHARRNVLRRRRPTPILDGPSRAYSFGLANAGVTSTGMRQFIADASPPRPPITATQLFPFKDAYGLYSGRCRRGEPDATSGGAVQIVDRAGIYTSDVYQPALRIKVVNGAQRRRRGRTSSRRSARARPAAATPDRAERRRDHRPHHLQRRPSATSATASSPSLRSPASPFDPGLPFGNWDICVDARSRRGPAVTTIVSNYSNRSTARLTTVTTLDTATGTTGRDVLMMRRLRSEERAHAARAAHRADDVDRSILLATFALLDHVLRRTARRRRASRRPRRAAWRWTRSRARCAPGLPVADDAAGRRRDRQRGRRTTPTSATARTRRPSGTR